MSCMGSKKAVGRAWLVTSRADISNQAKTPTYSKIARLFDVKINHWNRELGLPFSRDQLSIHDF